MAGKLFVAFLLAALATAHTVRAEDEVKIGVLGDMSGPTADVSGPGSVAAVQMAVDDFGGMVNGRKIVVLTGDHQLKPDIGAAIAQRWFDVEGVDVIVDLPVSTVALAVSYIARQRKKAILVTAGTTADLTAKACSPYLIHWADDTHALAEGTARAIVQNGGNSWYFLTVNFIFGATMEKAATDVILSLGGTVLGSSKTLDRASDFASYLLAAQVSKAQIVGLALAGADFINAVKQASEFGIVAGGQKLAGFLVYISDIHSLGLAAAHGLLTTESFYWDRNAASQAFAKRFMELRHVMPTKVHAENYAAVVHYLNAVKATGSTDATATVAWMKQHPADYFGQTAKIREDGRVLFDLMLYEVKDPKEMRYD